MTREQWVARLSTRGDALGGLLIIYFGQDWPDDYGEPWTNVIAAYVAKRGPDKCREVAAEIDELLGDGLSETDIDWLLHDGVHSALDWDRFGYPSWTAWLEAVRDELRRLC